MYHSEWVISAHAQEGYGTICVCVCLSVCLSVTPSKVHTAFV